MSRERSEVRAQAKGEPQGEPQGEPARPNTSQTSQTSQTSPSSRASLLKLTSVGLGLCLLTLVGWELMVRSAVQALPEPLFERPYASRLLDVKGRLLEARVASDEQWRFKRSEPIPERLKRALVRFEDQRFYQHLGVDPLALARAMWSNLISGRVVSGASTLTMQVVRLALRSPQRSLKTKLYETWLALGLERRYSKDELLELYLAHAPFGGNVVGLEAASWLYFHRPPKELTWAEGALLAVLPNQPGRLHLTRNRASLKEKRDRLLRALCADGALSEVDLHLALIEPLPTLSSRLPHLALHFFDTSSARRRARLNAQQPSGQLEGVTSERDLKSSLDQALQRSLSALLSRYGARLKTTLIHNAALVVIDNHTLLPVAYLGNLPQLKALQAPHLDIAQRPRSTGSLLKPILFASMLDAGELVPSSLVIDVPTTLSGFKPLNIDRRYRGVVSASEALIRSLNIPAVRMLQQHGVNVFYQTLSRLGLSLSRPAEEYGATLIIGGAEASLWSLSRMYALLAHKLLYPSLEESERVLRAGRDGLTPSLTLSPLKQTLRSLKALPLSRGAIWQTFEVLTDVVRPREHQGWRQLKSAQRVAWKTGTSQGLRDAWAIGVTPRYTVGVWVGNARGEGRPELTGAQAAAPLLFETFKRLAATSSEARAWFERPTEALEEVEVCVESGYLPVPACETERVLKPKGAPFVTQDSFYQLLNLDSSGVYRVTSECWPVAEMRREARFVLPPTVAWYHQKAGGLYEPLPPMHPQCATVLNPSEGLSISYPAEGAQLYLPVDLNGSLGELVARVTSARPTQPLYWHLDGEYLAMTRHFHELALSPKPGAHTLVVVSAEGGRVERRFKVLDVPR